MKNDLSTIYIFDYTALKVKIDLDKDFPQIEVFSDQETAWKSSLIVARILHILSRRKKLSSSKVFLINDNYVYYVLGDYIFIGVRKNASPNSNINSVRTLLDALYRFLKEHETIFLDDLVVMLEKFFSKWRMKQN